MTTEEFSNEFDTQLNSYAKTMEFHQPQNSGNNLTFDEYEKSVFLTKAQEQLVVYMYNGKLGQSFEETEENREYLKELIKTVDLSNTSSSEGLTDNSVFYKFPDDVLFITYEQVTLIDDSLPCPSTSGIKAVVVPITQDDFFRTNRDPFKNSNENRVLRLDVNSEVAELISKYNISKYTMRYVSKPAPIILTSLEGDQKINNIQQKTECSLNPILHRTILDLAVKAAYQSRSYSQNSNTEYNPYYNTRQQSQQ